MMLFDFNPGKAKCKNLGENALVATAGWFKSHYHRILTSFPSAFLVALSGGIPWLNGLFSGGGSLILW